MYTNDAGQAAPEAAFSGNEGSILAFRADCFRFTSKTVQISPYLLTKPLANPQKFACSSEHASIELTQMSRR
jgi:hypothetical protein